MSYCSCSNLSGFDVFVSAVGLCRGSLIPSREGSCWESFSAMRNLSHPAHPINLFCGSENYWNVIFLLKKHIIDLFQVKNIMIEYICKLGGDHHNKFS